jgi:hypothetical protein
LFAGGRLVCLGGDGVGGVLDPSTFLVKQHLPFPGHDPAWSISSQSRVKNPLTQLPLHPVKPSIVGGPWSLRCAGVVRPVVVLVVVVEGGRVVVGADDVCPPG